MAGQDAAEKGTDEQQTKSLAAMSDDGAVQKPLRGWRLLGVLFRWVANPKDAEQRPMTLLPVFH